MTSFDPTAHDGFAATARQAYAASAGQGSAATAARLAQDGILGVLASESVGGLAMTLEHAVPLAVEAGAALVAFPLIETLLVAKHCAAAAPALVTDLVAGKQVATIAWRGTVKARRGGSGLSLDGVVDRAPLAEHAPHVLVWTETGEAVLVPAATRGVAVSAGLSLALEAPDAVITFEHVTIAAPVVIPAPAATALRRDALILHAAAALGSAQAALAASVEHVSTRRQFGSALVANQAVRHMLARQKLGLEGVRSAIIRCFASGGDSLLAARAAFVHAADVGIKTAETAIQLHGGMGFTWDVPMHRHLRQIRTLVQRGDVEAVRDALAHDLVEPRNAVA